MSGVAVLPRVARIVAESPGVDAPVGELGAHCPAPAPADQLRWSRFVDATEAEGPGRRSALWVQGCAVRCPGCFNPHLWASRGAHLDETRALSARWVARARAAGASGITLLGGEPFDQAAALALVARDFRAAGLTVMTFTGYTLDALERWGRERPDIAALLRENDLLCDGPYLRDLPDRDRPWIGSRNQAIRALTDAHAADVSRIARGDTPTFDRLEVRLGADGSVAVNGWASDAALAALFDDLGIRVDRPTSLSYPSDRIEETVR